MKGFPAALAAAAVLFMAATPILLQGDPSSLRGVGVERGLLPESFALEGREVRFLLAPIDALDAERELLLILAPDIGYTDEEVATIRAFVANGGRLIVASDRGAAQDLLQRLDVGIEIIGTTLYTPVFRGTPDAMIAKSTGRIASLPAEVVVIRPVGVAGGDAILLAPDPTWEDENGNGRPDLGEPTVASAIASIATHGRGMLIVVGDPLFFHRGSPEVQSAFLDTLAEGERVLVFDAAHRTSADPFGISTLLASATSALARTAILISALGLGAIAVLAPRFTRERRAGRARLRAQRHSPEFVSKILSELHPR